MHLLLAVDKVVYSDGGPSLMMFLFLAYHVVICHDDEILTFLA